MSLMELFINYAKRNTCNTEEKKGVTPTAPATQRHNTHNTCNTENNTFSKKTENIQLSTPAIKVYRYRVTDKPDSELTIITHGEPLSEVREGLLMRYGDRLITVYDVNLGGILASSTKH